jgi:hypothetical protein
MLEADCLSKMVPIEYLCERILEMATHVEQYEIWRPFGSRQFWHGIRLALDANGIQLRNCSSLSLTAYSRTECCLP